MALGGLREGSGDIQVYLAFGPETEENRGQWLCFGINNPLNHQERGPAKYDRAWNQCLRLKRLALGLLDEGGRHPLAGKPDDGLLSPPDQDVRGRRGGLGPIPGVAQGTESGEDHPRRAAQEPRQFSRRELCL